MVRSWRFQLAFIHYIRPTANTIGNVLGHVAHIVDVQRALGLQFVRLFADRGAQVGASLPFTTGDLQI